jgi:hypothetical protein
LDYPELLGQPDQLAHKARKVHKVQLVQLVLPV